MRNYTAESGGINGGVVDFMNASIFDFTLKSTSAVINKALVLSGFDYDARGYVRGSSWDMGAYEYTNSASTLKAPQNLRIVP
jgi:hypothetical protein